MHPKWMGWEQQNHDDRSAPGPLGAAAGGDDISHWHLATITGNTHTLVVELMAWLKAPPSSAIPDLIEELTGALQALTGAVEAQGQQIAALPAAVARTVGTGEV